MKITVIPIVSVIIIALLITLFSVSVYAGPSWTTKIPEGYANKYFMGIGESPLSMSDAKKLAVSNVIMDIVNSNTITATSDFTSTLGESVQQDGKRKFIDEVIEEVRVKGHSTKISGLVSVENYSEMDKRDGKPIHRVYVLMRIPKKNPQKAPDSLYFLSRSAVAPGWAQFLKGHNKRAWTIIISESLSVPIMLLSFTLKYREDHIKENITDYYDSNISYYRDQHKERSALYNSIFLGSAAVAATAYVYNLIDAVIAKDDLHMAVIPTPQNYILTASLNF